MKRKSLIFLGIILLLVAGYAYPQTVPNTPSNEKTAKELSAIKDEIKIIKQSVEELEETVKDSTSTISALGNNIDSLKNNLQENTKQNISIESRLSTVENTLSNIDSNGKPIKNEILTKAESSVEYAKFLIDNTSIALTLFGIIVLVFGIIYYLNLRRTKEEANLNLIKIKELVKEGETIIARQKTIFRDFENEARSIFDNANIPGHLFPDDFTLMQSRPTSLSSEQKKKIEDIILEALIYKSLLPKQNHELARVFIRIGHYFMAYENDDEKAKIYYEYAIKVFNDDHVAYTCLGRLMIKQENYEGALIMFDKSIALKNDYWLPYYDKGWIYDELGRYDEAIIEYKKAQGFAPKEARIPFNIACSHSKNNNQKEAYVYLKKSIDLSSESKHKALKDKDLQPLFQNEEFGSLAEKICK